jgi:hypothetical protein
MFSCKMINKFSRINENINSFTLFVTFFGTKFHEKPYPILETCAHKQRDRRTDIRADCCSEGTKTYLRKECFC